MTPDKVLDRIKKLLALAGNNPSEAEAANAAALAQKLMTEHKISMAEVNEQASEPMQEKQVWLRSQRIPVWKGRLWRAICDVNDCSSMRSREYVSSDGRVYARFHAFGRRDATQTVAYLYQYLQKEVDRLAREAVTSRSLPKGPAKAFGDSFRKGCVDRVCSRLREAFTKVKREAKARGQTTALMRLDKEMALATAFRDKQHTTRKVYHRSGASDLGGYHAGRVAGDKIRLRRDNKGLRAPAKQLEK